MMSISGGILAGCLVSSSPFGRVWMAEPDGAVAVSRRDRDLITGDETIKATCAIHALFGS